MAIVKNKQLTGVLTNPFTGSLIVSNSLNVIGTASANIFSGTFIGDGSQITNIPLISIDTGSFATTASNVFYGNQTINGQGASSIFLINSASYTLFETNYNGQTTISSNASNVFLIKNFAGDSILTVSQSGMVVLATHSIELNNPAPVGGIYFTSNSFFVGLL